MIKCSKILSSQSSPNSLSKAFFLNRVAYVTVLSPGDGLILRNKYRAKYLFLLGQNYSLSFFLSFMYSSSLPSDSGRYFSRCAISLPPDIKRASFLSAASIILKNLNSLSVSSSHCSQAVSTDSGSPGLNGCIGKFRVSVTTVTAHSGLNSHLLICSV